MSCADNRVQLIVLTSHIDVSLVFLGPTIAKSYGLRDKSQNYSQEIGPQSQVDGKCPQQMGGILPVFT